MLEIPSKAFSPLGEVGKTSVNISPTR